MLSRILVYIALFFCFSCFNSFASDYAALDKFIVDAKSVTNSVSGTSVVLIKEGKIVHEIHVGMADVENKVPVDTNSVYYFASTTKAIMGLAVLEAERLGILSRDTSLRQLFPNVDFRYIDANNYSVIDLLSHRSGLVNEAMTWTFSYTGNHDKEQRLHFISSLKQHPESDKGEFEYTNLGYNIMAIWFDENFKGGWTSAINELVLSPAGMSKSTADVDRARAKDWQIPKPYSYKFQNGQSEIYMNKNNDTLYSVGIFARPNDWGRLITHLLPINKDNSAFPESVVKESQTLLVSDINSYFSGYGWGWMYSEIAGEQVLMHTGGFDGSSVEVSYVPEKNVGVIIVHNESGLIANELNGSISEIAYKMLTSQKMNDTIDLHREEMNELAIYVDKAKAEISAKRDELLKRRNESPPNHISLEGIYANKDVGLVSIENRNSGLFLDWGDLQSKVYFGSIENELVVELRPGKFYDVKVNKEMSAIELKGWSFHKVK